MTTIEIELKPNRIGKFMLGLRNTSQHKYLNITKYIIFKYN